MADDQKQARLPKPVPAERFHPSGEDAGAWANINRAPHDRVSGVVYKRAVNIASVRYEPFPFPGPLPKGEGAVDVRWLFSEHPGTEEDLLAGRPFSYLQDLTLSPGARTGEQAHSGLDMLIYVIEGGGDLLHRPTAGSPIFSRPLRPGDAALVAGGELYSVSNTHSRSSLRLMVLALQAEGPRQADGAPGTSSTGG